jgi:large subunit ribosomal protein L24
MKIRKGDTVKILYGKERGKRGPVVAVDVKKQKVIVEGLNLYKRHLNGDGQTRTSEIVTIEKPFPISKVMLVCPVCNKATRVTVKKDGKEIVRVCKKCGKDIAEVTKKAEKKEGPKKESTKKKSTTTKKTTTKKTTKKKVTKSKGKKE